ncbi:hypothetical protein MRX96_027136 [Rhipicephalus microplus]
MHCSVLWKLEPDPINEGSQFAGLQDALTLEARELLLPASKQRLQATSAQQRAGRRCRRRERPASILPQRSSPSLGGDPVRRATGPATPWAPPFLPEEETCLLPPSLHCRRKIHATDRPGSAALPSTAAAAPRSEANVELFNRNAAVLQSLFSKRHSSSSTSSLRSEQEVCVSCSSTRVRACLPPSDGLYSSIIPRRWRLHSGRLQRVRQFVPAPRRVAPALPFAGVARQQQPRAVERTTWWQPAGPSRCGGITPRARPRPPACIRLFPFPVLPSRASSRCVRPPQRKAVVVDELARGRSEPRLPPTPPSRSF